ncbi:TPA: phage gp6-like head-tail connector protein [Citrobacter freundii]|nr:phage gp6-like head-tail connector protein [Citrobacter freundii]HEF0069925.1 phage gp6-like head-tail connector protein [Citrobacter freundii]
MKPSIAELRQQCRIDSDDVSEDQTLAIYLSAAKFHAEKLVNRSLYDTSIPDNDPDGIIISDDIKLALMLLVSHWYENREPVNIGNITSTLPFGVQALLGPYRKHPGT